MTFKLTKTRLLKALITTLCMLAVAFAVVLLTPRGAVSADETADEAPYNVTWEYKINNSDDAEWMTFVNGRTLFTYEEGVDYSALVRVKIDLGEGINPTYVYYSESGADTHLSYSGTFNGTSVDKLINAAEYTVTIVGADNIADADKTITIKIAPRVLDLRASDLVDYAGGDDPNRLWLLNDNSELGDLATYYDPTAEFSDEYGAQVTTGDFYNSYVRYTGKPQTVILNGDYDVNDKTLKDYYSAITVAYDSETSTGLANRVNKITTTATITLNPNWTLDDGNSIVITKEWYIVTINNALRTLDGNENTAVEGWTFGAEAPALSLRPEHGDNAVFTLGKDNTVLARFAIKYSGKGEDTVLEYYDVKSENGGYVIDTENALDDDYCATQFAALGVGAYTLNVSVPSYTSTDDHEHWWENAEEEASSIVYYPISRTYHFTVGCYAISADSVSVDGDDGKDIVITFLTDRVTYNAMENNVPEAVVTFRGVTLKDGVDYELQSHDIKVGKASLTFVGKGSFTGTVPFEDMYYIDPAVNSWKEVPSIMYWTYGNYDKQMNLINATPLYLDNPNGLWFKITTDSAGEIPAATPLASFRLTDGLVPNNVAESLSSLSVGTYYLFATVEESTNYKALAPRGIAFKVFKATNYWETAPTIDTWREGSFKSSNLPIAQPVYGTANIIITNSQGKEVYNTITGVNKLNAAESGTYTLTATVLGTSDYEGVVYSMVFTVYEKLGIPVWATVLIVLGALLLAAIIIFILIKTDVLRILTGKILIGIRTQATIDATIAAVRANKKNEEAKQRVAEIKQKELDEAKKEEQRAKRRERAAKERSLTVDQRIAALEEKANKTAARAEKMKQRAEVMQKRAERLKGAAEPEQAPEPEIAPTAEPEIAPTAEAAATETPETSTED
ncbi:MAG: hypothetical protein K2M47_04980 [Clostridiales bacterium]|nr:hypothetical protein [Clostridiales bacterium]